MKRSSRPGTKDGPYLDNEYETDWCSTTLFDYVTITTVVSLARLIVSTQMFATVKDFPDINNPT